MTGTDPLAIDIGPATWPTFEAIMGANGGRGGCRRMLWRRSAKEGAPLPTKTYNHVAFRMSPDDYDDRLERIRSLGLKAREGQSCVAGECHSICFHGYDNHMFELHSGTLEECLRRYADA